MKIFFTILCLFFATQLFAQQFEEVVYLKNGSIVRGTIIEQTPNVSIKIQTKDKSVFAYRMDEILKITKEEIISNYSETSSSSHNSYSQQSKIAIGGQVGLSIPMGNFGDVANMGFDISGNFLYTFNQNIDITGSIGYINWGMDAALIEKKYAAANTDIGALGVNVDADVNVDVSFTNVPIVVGGRYYFEHKNFSPYAIANLGINFLGYSAKGTVKGTISAGGYSQKFDNPVNDSKSETEIGFGFGGGFLYNLGNIKLDVNAKFNIISDHNHFTIMAGILFPLQ